MKMSKRKYYDLKRFENTYRCVSWLIDLQRIKKQTADEFGISIEDLDRRRTDAHTDQIRHIAMARCARETSAPLTLIAYTFERYHHTTVRHAIEKAKGVQQMTFKIR